MLTAQMHLRGWDMARNGLPRLATDARKGLYRIGETANGGAEMTAKYGNRNVTKMIREWRALADLCRAEGTPAIQDALDRVEQHIDYAYGAKAEGGG